MTLNSENTEVHHQKRYEDKRQRNLGYFMMFLEKHVAETIRCPISCFGLTLRKVVKVNYLQIQTAV